MFNFLLTCYYAIPIKLTTDTSTLIDNMFINHLHLDNRMMENVDILLISETKLNDTFPVSQFMVGGFHTPYREDRNDNGGGLLLYVREHIPCKRILSAN